MNKLLLIITTLTLLACGKGNHTGKVWNYTPELGANDPCGNNERCEFIEYLSFNDPLLEKKVHKYFPGYQLGQSKLYLYEVGQKYSLKKEGNYNQSYDFEDGKYNPGCKVSFDETRTIYKIIEGLVDEDGKSYTRLVYKYKTENPVLLTKTTECEDFLDETWEFDDEDFKAARVYAPTNDLVVQTTAGSLNIDPNAAKIHFFVVRVDGEYFVRRTVEVKNHKQDLSVFNPDSGQWEDITITADLYQITVSHPDENSIGNKYEYLEVITDGVKTIADASNLTEIKLVTVDSNEAPDEP